MLIRDIETGYFKTKVKLGDFQASKYSEGAERICDKILDTLGKVYSISDIKVLSATPYATSIAITFDKDVDVSKRFLLLVRSGLEDMLSIGGISVHRNKKLDFGIIVDIPHIDEIALDYFRLTDTLDFKAAREATTFCLGVDGDGDAIFTSLQELTHLLITSKPYVSSGFINALILSLIERNGADKLKLLIYDSPLMRLDKYNEIAHMLCPALITFEELSAILYVLYDEIKVRLMRLSDSGATSTRELNKLVETGELQGSPLCDIVVIINDFADFRGNEKEYSLLLKMLKMSAAVGVHFVLVSSSFSQDIISESIKNSVVSRIAFELETIHESFTVLGEAGAEALASSGDMLALMPWSYSPLRLRAPYVPSDDMQNTIFENKLDKSYYDARFLSALMAVTGISANKETSSDLSRFLSDENFIQAVKAAATLGYVTINLLQSKFKLGYKRAVSYIDAMMKLGVIETSKDYNRRIKSQISDDNAIAIKEKLTKGLKK